MLRPRRRGMAHALPLPVEKSRRSSTSASYAANEANRADHRVLSGPGTASTGPGTLPSRLCLSARQWPPLRVYRAPRTNRDRRPGPPVRRRRSPHSDPSGCPRTSGSYWALVYIRRSWKIQIIKTHPRSQVGPNNTSSGSQLARQGHPDATGRSSDQTARMCSQSSMGERVDGDDKK